ncbi:MAG TPA: response regulator [Ktedonobacterales bacterium]|nr:response regulator [Ktedonobacterales bacterium]
MTKIAKNENGAHKTDDEQPSKIRILVINDTQEILEAFRDILEEEGYEVLLYSFAVTAIEDIERVAPDLIILDYIFGGERLGWQILQLLKMHRSTAAIPIIICSAATREVRDITGYLTAHDIQLVPKPFDIDDLLSAVKQALTNATRSANLVLDEADRLKRPDAED